MDRRQVLELGVDVLFGVSAQPQPPQSDIDRWYVKIVTSERRFAALVCPPGWGDFWSRCRAFYWADVDHHSRWTDARWDNPIIQHSINSLLIKIETKYPNTITENDIEMVLTSEQANGIASSDEYRNYCLGAPDALAGPGNRQYERNAEARRGEQPTLKSGDGLYGIPVRIVER